MPATRLFRFLRLLLPVSLFVFPVYAHADAYSGLTYGAGPDGYRFWYLVGDFKISRTIGFNLDHLLARSEGVEDTRQTGLGIFWRVIEPVSLNYRYSDTNDGRVKVAGNEAGISLALNTLWHGERQTTLDLGYGKFLFKAADPKTVLAANWSLSQERSSLGISQEVSKTFTVYGTHDRYSYDRNLNLQGLQLLDLLRNRPRLASSATTVLSYPDRSNKLGMSWGATDSLSLDISVGKTITLLEQELKDTRLAVDYQVGDRLNLGIAVTRSTSTAVVNSSQTVVLPASSANYTEATLGISF